MSDRYTFTFPCEHGWTRPHTHNGSACIGTEEMNERQESMRVQIVQEGPVWGVYAIYPILQTRLLDSIPNGEYFLVPVESDVSAAETLMIVREDGETWHCGNCGFQGVRLFEGKLDLDAGQPEGTL